MPVEKIVQSTSSVVLLVNVGTWAWAGTIFDDFSSRPSAGRLGAQSSRSRNGYSWSCTCAWQHRSMVLGPLLPVFLFSVFSPEGSEVPVSDFSKSGGTNLYSMHVMLLQCSGKTLIVYATEVELRIYIYQVGALDSFNVGATRVRCGAVFPRNIYGSWSFEVLAVTDESFIMIDVWRKESERVCRGL